MFQPSYVTYLSILSLHGIYAARAIRPQRLWIVRNRVNNAISNDRAKSSSYREVMGCVLLLIKTSGFEICTGYFPDLLFRNFVATEFFTLRGELLLWCQWESYLFFFSFKKKTHNTSYRTDLMLLIIWKLHCNSSSELLMNLTLIWLSVVKSNAGHFGGKRELFNPC